MAGQMTGHIPKPLQPYWNYRDELTVQNQLIYKGAQVMIPQSMQTEMLRKIHANHFGAESNIRMAREVLFWPGMTKAIEDMCNSCSTCAQYGKTATENVLVLVLACACACLCLCLLVVSPDPVLACACVVPVRTYDITTQAQAQEEGKSSFFLCLRSCLRRPGSRVLFLVLMLAPYV